MYKLNQYQKEQICLLATSHPYQIWIVEYVFFRCDKSFDKTEKALKLGATYNSIERGINEVNQAARGVYAMEFKYEGFAKHNHEFYIGQKIKTRGDIGSFNGVIVKIHNESFCTIFSHGKNRHMNMAFIEPRAESNNWFRRILIWLQIIINN